MLEFRAQYLEEMREIWQIFLTLVYNSNTMLFMKGRIRMDKPKLQIKPKKFTEESTIMSMRIPKDMIRALDEVAAKTGRTRNEIVMMSLEFALENMEILDQE